MIELRWHVTYTNGYECEPGVFIVNTEKTLQSRHKGDSRPGYPETTWGSWEDVPEVEDDATT